MKKMMMMLIMATVAMTASAQNTLRETGAFTLQPKVGIGLGHISGSYDGDFDPKFRAGFVGGLEGEYYAAPWLGIALGVNYAQQGWTMKSKTKARMIIFGFLRLALRLRTVTNIPI